MNRRFLVLPALLVLVSAGPVSAEMSDAEYCGQLSALANKYVSGGGGDGKSFPDLKTVAAINDCNQGNYAQGIPVLEKRLRDSRVTLPKR